MKATLIVPALAAAPTATALALALAFGGPTPLAGIGAPFKAMDWLAGRDDEVFSADGLAGMFADAGRPAAVEAVVAALQRMESRSTQ